MAVLDGASTAVLDVATTAGKYDRLEEETSTTRHSDHHGNEEEEVRAT